MLSLISMLLAKARLDLSFLGWLQTRRPGPRQWCSDPSRIGARCQLPHGRQADDQACQSAIPALHLSTMSWQTLGQQQALLKMEVWVAEQARGSWLSRRFQGRLQTHCVPAASQQAGVYI